MSISQTVLDIEPELIPYPSGTRPESLPAAADLTVDGLGQVWASWSVREDLDEYDWIESFFISQISHGESRIINLKSETPFGWRAFRFAADTDQTWCAVREDVVSFPDLLRVFPCHSPESEQVLETDSSWWTWDLLILAGEPVIIENQGNLQARHVLSGQIKEISFSWPTAPFLFDYLLQSTSIGSAPVILSSGVIYPPHSGGSESYSVLSVFQDEHWRSDAVLRHLSTFFRTSPGYNLATDLGSDRGSLVYMAFVQDGFPQPSDREQFYPPFDVSWQPKIRVFEGTALGTVEEWTLGYSETVETMEKGGLAPHSFMAVTSGHEHVGFAVIHAGNLDLWVVKGQSWFGPYQVDRNVDGPSESPVQPPVDIAVDGKGRYFISWMKSGTPFIARFTQEDLGLEGGAATDIRTEEGPQRPMLAQNSPNPFNAQTTIEVVTAREEELDIFDLMGQRIRSIPTGPGINRVVWDGSDDSGRPVASGVYLYRLRDSRGAWSFKRMVLIR